MRAEIALSDNSKRYLKKLSTMKDVRQARKQYVGWRHGRRESKLFLATLFVLADGKCPFCGVEMVLHFGSGQEDNRATLDHITPLSKTLTHDKFNLQIMCRKCNVEVKKDRLIEEGDFLLEVGAITKEENDKYIEENI